MGKSLMSCFLTHGVYLLSVHFRTNATCCLFSGCAAERESADDVIVVTWSPWRHIRRRCSSSCWLWSRWLFAWSLPRVTATPPPRSGRWRSGEWPACPATYSSAHCFPSTDSRLSRPPTPASAERYVDRRRRRHCSDRFSSLYVLQCFDTWLGVRKSIRPVTIEWWGVGVVICLEQGADCLRTVQLMPLYPETPSSLASFKSRLVYLSGTGIPRLSSKRGR